MNPADHINLLQKKVEKRLKELFDHQEPRSLYDPMFHPLKSGGKRIRPLLLLLSAEAVGGDGDQYLNAATAIELLHTFTLVHDDIMDHDNMRRGHPAVHVCWDEATAILAGDGLVTLAFQSLLHNDHPNLIEVIKRFTKGLLILCEGQALDKSFENKPSVSMPEYLDMIYKKTAKLIEVSCETGAMLGNGSQKEIQALKHFSKELGIAFQIQDDLLDLISEETVFGKPQCSDLIEKKKTYLTIHFEQTADKENLQKYQSLQHQNFLSPENIKEIRNLFRQTGTFDATRMKINQSIETALQHLALLSKSMAYDTLKYLTLKIRDRIM